jgi:hypothetical protein
MVRGGIAEAPVPRSDVSFRLDQQTGHFKLAFIKAARGSREMQWSALTEEKQKNQFAQTEFRFINNNDNNKGRQLLFGLRVHISVALQQKTANFKVVIANRLNQWSLLTEKRINLCKMVRLHK